MSHRTSALYKATSSRLDFYSSCLHPYWFYNRIIKYLFAPWGNFVRSYILLIWEFCSWALAKIKCLYTPRYCQHALNIANHQIIGNNNKIFSILYWLWCLLHEWKLWYRVLHAYITCIMWLIWKSSFCFCGYLLSIPRSFSSLYGSHNYVCIFFIFNSFKSRRSIVYTLRQKKKCLNYYMY